jgi:hypothetical protein
MRRPGVAGQAAWRCSVGTPKSAADLPDDFGGGGVSHVAHAVDVPDGGAGHVEGAHRAAGRGAFGQVSAQRERVTGQGRDATHGAPTFPLAPDQCVHLSG